MVQWLACKPSKLAVRVQFPVKSHFPNLSFFFFPLHFSFFIFHFSFVIFDYDSDFDCDRIIQKLQQSFTSPQLFECKVSFAIKHPRELSFDSAPIAQKMCGQSPFYEPLIKGCLNGSIFVRGQEVSSLSPFFHSLFLLSLFPFIFSHFQFFPFFSHITPFLTLSIHRIILQIERKRGTLSNEYR